MLPNNFGKTGGYAGASVWGSSPPIDIHRNVVYIATGNLYSVPENIRKCQERENNQTAPTHPDECVEPDNHSESILALDLDAGKIKWKLDLEESLGEEHGELPRMKEGCTLTLSTPTTRISLKRSAKNTTAGGWLAMDAETKWPMVSSLLFGGSTNPKGPIYAIDIRTVIWANNTVLPSMVACQIFAMATSSSSMAIRTRLEGMVAMSPSPIVILFTDTEQKGTYIWNQFRDWKDIDMVIL
ncbi:hypothetical protein SLEP1_g10279 [Rubroshorea leprosula]|uniref:Uncharacterized protein n=1 Tax=Rubroshorea leprosula TaxID=152421 RepID=A0AAV5IFI3_9ROSI|nr:hypothetical protein SLEP1_g10279 [Rubroshorea leprosula]